MNLDIADLAFGPLISHSTLQSKFLFSFLVFNVGTLPQARVKLFRFNKKMFNNSCSE